MQMDLGGEDGHILMVAKYSAETAFKKVDGPAKNTVYLLRDRVF